jgi:hypothetical protein
MSASSLLSGSPAAVNLVASAGQTASFNNATVTGVKSLSGGDAAGLTITATGAFGLNLVSTVDNVTIQSQTSPPLLIDGAGSAVRTAGAAGGSFTVAKNAAGAVDIAAYLPISVGGVNYWVPLCPTDPQTT